MQNTEYIDICQSLSVFVKVCQLDPYVGTATKDRALLQCFHQTLTARVSFVCARHPRKAIFPVIGRWCREAFQSPPRHTLCYFVRAIIGKCKSIIPKCAQIPTQRCGDITSRGFAGVESTDGGIFWQRNMLYLLYPMTLRAMVPLGTVLPMLLIKHNFATAWTACSQWQRRRNHMRMTVTLIISPSIKEFMIFTLLDDKLCSCMHAIHEVYDK